MWPPPDLDYRGSADYHSAATQPAKKELGSFSNPGRVGNLSALVTAALPCCLPRTGQPDIKSLRFPDFQ